MKEEILEKISMQDILDKYGIENNQRMFSCPFHGEDKHPSAKIYKNSYCCFACNKADTTIGFVMDLFNLSFKEAMQKINYDFNLNLDSNYVDYDKLNMIKSQQYEHKKIKERQKKKYCELCDIRFTYLKILKYFKSKKITINNWETLTMIISDFETKLCQIENSLQILDEKLSSRI